MIWGFRHEEATRCTLPMGVDLSQDSRQLGVLRDSGVDCGHGHHPALCADSRMGHKMKKRSSRWGRSLNLEP